MQQSLLEFFRSSKAQGASDQVLVELFKRRGWSERQIFAALQTYYEQQTGIELPQRPSSWEGARDAFVYLLSFLALCSWVWSLGSLWFTFINAAFPDPLAPESYYSVRSTLAFALSGLIVALPLYLICLRVLGRELSRNPDKLDSGVRKWLTYMAMLIAAGVILGDLIYFLNQFLRGELTLRFALKSAAVLALAGCVLWYHLGAVGRSLDLSWILARDRAYAAMLVVAALVSGVFGFLRLGSPATSRLIEADFQRASDLTRIASQVHSYWTGKQRLPAALSELPAVIRAADPIGGKPYEYRPLANSTYQVCAEFATDSRAEARSSAAYPRNGRFADHPAGRHCFSVDAAVPSW
jgi:hypothetical protein